MLGQTRFMASRRIFVNKTFVDSFINNGNCRIQKFTTLILVTAGERRPKTFNLSSQFTAVAAVDGVALGILSDALFG